MKAMCILGNGFEELEAVGSIDLLYRAGIEIDVYALENEEALGSHNIHIARLKSTMNMNIEAYDILLISGGAHYKLLEASELVKECIQAFNRDQKIIAAICAAPTILGHMGILTNRNYTCFTSMDEDFGGIYQDQYVVCDAHIITGKSAAAVFAFAFAIIEKAVGKEKVEEVKKAIYYQDEVK